MSQPVEDRIRELPTLRRPGLLSLWADLFERASPEKLRKELMVPILAYRMQEKAYGGLKPATRTRLRQLARALEQDPAANIAAVPQIKPGTRLLREWRGETHEVIAEDAGYNYRGKRFDSLSEIARHITGTRWSGPLFFGLKAPQPTGSRPKGTRHA